MPFIGLEDSPAPAPSAPKRTAKLITVLRITQGDAATYYHVSDLPPENGRPAFRLRKLVPNSDLEYTVHYAPHGWECTCGDFTFRHQNAPESCKHILGLAAVTLLHL